LLSAVIGLTLVFISLIGLSSSSSFGESPSGELLKRIKASAQYQHGSFVKVVVQTPRTIAASWKGLVEQFTRDQVRVSPLPIPMIAISPERFETHPELGPRSIWLDHAGVLLELDDFRLLVDPMFSERASALTFAGPKHFQAQPVSLSALKIIDAVMIYHDHCDHLDMPTFQYLASKAAHFYVPLGIEAHLKRRGMPENQITDMQRWVDFKRRNSGGSRSSDAERNHLSYNTMNTFYGNPKNYSFLLG